MDVVFKPDLSFLIIPVNWIEHKSRRTLYCVFELCYSMNVKHELLSRVPWVCVEKHVEVVRGDSVYPPEKHWVSTAFHPFNERLVKA